MNNTEKQFDRVEYLVSKRRIKNALEELSRLLKPMGIGEFTIQFENLESTYENMLKYTVEGVPDPERQKVYNHLLSSILGLSDRVKNYQLSEISGWHTYWLKSNLEKQQSLTGKDIVEKLDDLSFKKELDEILKEESALSEDSYRERTRKYRELMVKIFHHIWLTDDCHEAETDLIKTVKNNEHFTWYERSIFISALTLSLLRYFDKNKFTFLFEFYDSGEDQVWQRALVGIVFGLYYYDKRIHLYPEIVDRLKLLSEVKGIQGQIESVILQLIRSKETEKISRKLREEIIPEMTKLGPNLQEKLDLDNLAPDEIMDEKNPDWKKVFKDSEDLYGKMEEFSKLQMEGADVFMSAFAMLKHFDFFKEISNWFLPFYPENGIIDEALSHEDPEFDKAVFIEGLYKSNFICNSDKYSFCLNIKQMPLSQKTVILKLFNMELEGMEQMASEQEALDRSKTVFTQYIQDLYRFFKLYPNKREFPDIFAGKLDIYNTRFFTIVIQERSITRKIADYFFDKDSYEEALELYIELLEYEKPDNQELNEKIAFCHQRLGQYEEALSYYRKSELFDKNRLWNLKKIAFCYRKLRDPEKALKYYKEAEKIEPDNLFIQASIGRCYLDLKEFDKALKYYFKVEFLEPENKNVVRPIAWCYFTTGNLEGAKKYYDKLFENEVNKYDLINRGHVSWCMGDKKEAIRFYTDSINEENQSIEEFLETFWDDSEYLVGNGIDSDEIPIILDYIQYQVRK